MAIKKAIISRYDGSTLVNGYWRVIGINRNIGTGDSHVVMAGYVNKAARDAGSQPIDSRSFDYNKDNNPFVLAELDKVGVNAVKIAYDTIKAATTTDENGVVTPGEFNGAIDVI